MYKHKNYYVIKVQHDADLWGAAWMVGEGNQKDAKKQEKRTSVIWCLLVFKIIQ